MSNDPNVPGGTTGRSAPVGRDRNQAGSSAGQTRQGDETKDRAKQEATEVKDHGKQEATEVKDHTKQEATAVKDHATGAARDVAGTAKDEARSVAKDAQGELRGLVDSGMDELNSQAGTGQQKLAEQIRPMVDELKEMADGSQHDGVATHLVSDLARRGDNLVGWMESHEPRDAVGEIRRFAANNPWAYLGVAAGLGLLVGRFARGLRDDNKDDDDQYGGQYSGQRGTYRPQTSGGRYDDRYYSTYRDSGTYRDSSSYRDRTDYADRPGYGADEVYGQRETYGEREYAAGPTQGYAVPATPSYDETARGTAGGPVGYDPLGPEGENPRGDRR